MSQGLEQLSAAFRMRDGSTLRVQIEHAAVFRRPWRVRWTADGEQLDLHTFAQAGQARRFYDDQVAEMLAHPGTYGFELNEPGVRILGGELSD